MLILFLAAGVGAMFLAHTAPFPFILEGMAGPRAIWRLRNGHGQPMVYLTFDDGPNPTTTPELLDALSRHGATATFFLIDRHVTAETAPIVQRLFEEGHSVGLHADTRKLMLMPSERVAEVLTAAADRIERLSGSRPCPIFRPHAGWRSGSMYEGLHQIDHSLVGWGWMLWDWDWYRRPNPAKLAARLARRVSPGDIIVIHDGHHIDPRADRRYAIETIELLIPALRERGFTFGTVC